MKKKIVILIAFLLALFAAQGCQHLAKSYDDAVINYEEYQSIYNTCQQINQDLCNMRSIPDTSKMFEQFPKEQRIIGLQAKMNRWVEEYNAKSKMLLREIWKSTKLPYQLSTQEFSCY